MDPHFPGALSLGFSSCPGSSSWDVPEAHEPRSPRAPRELGVSGHHGNHTPFSNHQAWQLSKDMGRVSQSRALPHCLLGVVCASPPRMHRGLQGQGLCLIHVPVLGWQGPRSRRRTQQGLEMAVSQLGYCVSIQTGGSATSTLTAAEPPALPRAPDLCLASRSLEDSG